MRLALVGVYGLLLVALFFVMGCGKEASSTPASNTHGANTLMGSVVVEVYERGAGKAPGMDVVATLDNDKVGIDTITITFTDGSVSFIDLCCNWYRTEDMWGLTWGAHPKGANLKLSPPVRNDVLVKGNWVAHFSFVGETVPTVVSVSHTEVEIRR